MALFDRYTKYDYNQKDYGCRSGQVWKCDNQYLIIDDVLCIEKYDIIKPKMFNSVITSPPYNANTSDLYKNSFNDNKSDIVLETFAGTGTVLIQCYKRKRISYNIEINPEFANIILNRFNIETGKEPELLTEVK